MRRTSLVLILTLVLGLLVTGVARAQDTKTVIDGLGRKVTVKGTPESVVTTTASTTEIVLDLGLDKRLVGVPDLIPNLMKYLSYVPELQAKVKDKTKVGVLPLSKEKIVKLNPDLVVLDASTQKGEVDKLKKLDATVYAAGSKNIDEVKESILELGYLTGKLKRAKKIVGNMVYQQVRLKQAVDQLGSKKKVFYTLSPQMYTPGGNTFVGQELEMAGLNNVFGDISGYKPVGMEEIIQQNPGLIIGTKGMGLSKGELKKKVGMNKVKAVKKDNVILLSSKENSLLNQPGTKIVRGAISLFETVYNKKVDLD